MLSKDTLIKVTNRSYGSVAYTVADLGIRRDYQPNEIKEVTFEEMLKLSYSTGGKKLIEKYLVMDNEEAVTQILGVVEPEYFYTANDVKELLLNGTLAQLQDCLDFADTGVIGLVQKFAVDLEINDVAKRKAIFDKTGFSVDSAIMINHETAEDSEEKAQTTRRAEPIKKTGTEASTGRRTAAPISSKYKVTSISK